MFREINAGGYVVQLRNIDVTEWWKSPAQLWTAERDGKASLAVPPSWPMKGEFIPQTGLFVF